MLRLPLGLARPTAFSARRRRSMWVILGKKARDATMN
jgi:hypothetical protein